MPTIRFTQNLRRHVACEDGPVVGRTVRDVLDRYFEGREVAKAYVLDDQGALRPHVMIFVDGDPVADRRALSDAVTDASEIDVIQALSGG